MVACADEPGREDVLAGLLTQLEVVTGAGRCSAEGDTVRAAGGLRRHDPDALGENDLDPSGDFQSLQLAEVHGVIPEENFCWCRG